MQLVEILAEMRLWNIYETGEWAEYVSYFCGVGPCELPEIDDPAGSEIGRRILAGAAGPAEAVDPSISGKIVRAERVGDLGPDGSMQLGVVSGCFDLLHLGHAKGMAYAKTCLRQRGNAPLCVLTLSDATIAESKGEGHPVLNVNERLRMLAGLRCVDYVIVLPERDCLSMLGRLPVGWYFKSEDDLRRPIVQEETDLVRSRGAEVCVFPDPVSRITSTTEIINRIREAAARTEVSDDE